MRRNTIFIYILLLNCLCCVVSKYKNIVRTMHRRQHLCVKKGITIKKGNKSTPWNVKECIVLVPHTNKQTCVLLLKEKVDEEDTKTGEGG